MLYYKIGLHFIFHVPLVNFPLAARSWPVTFTLGVTLVGDLGDSTELWERVARVTRLAGGVWFIDTEAEIIDVWLTDWLLTSVKSWTWPSMSNHQMLCSWNYTTVKSYNFMGTKFHGFTRMDMFIISRDAKGYCFHLPVNRSHLPVNYRLTDKQHKSFHDEC